ncbi:Gibberellin 2-beta-dioxygenase 8 [Quillaja saponaria]|uniref:gibberellin 2beta-dioxygenase n=1 Tax=Quillaja saponaria TaxID=32244 RepID=A0AAD7VMZ1_QUISA|nr:Gibberellin 2-beta-dioxygenase 8 [Quillaja saponaria]
MDYEPPFLEKYKTLLQNSFAESKNDYSCYSFELPLIDLGKLNNLHHFERNECMEKIREAARKWGFFQVVNHGVSQQVLESLQYELIKVFHQPFEKKSEDIFLNLSDKSYRWGNPMATSLRQLSWSEAFHIPLTDISSMNSQHKTLRSTIEAFATIVAHLAENLAEILSQKSGIKPGYFHENCLPVASYLRMNRYPPCPVSSKVFGLLPHSDSSFLTILYQDQVGGLQLMRDGKWFGVKPNPNALIVNIGDLFQALSNGVYKSIKHRVIAAEKVERFSVAYFYCPSNDAVIQGCGTPALYRKLSFKEYKEQNEKDVKETGDKVGLSRFLL